MTFNKMIKDIFHLQDNIFRHLPFGRRKHIIFFLYSSLYYLYPCIPRQKCQCFATVLLRHFFGQNATCRCDKKRDEGCIEGVLLFIKTSLLTWTNRSVLNQKQLQQAPFAATVMLFKVLDVIYLPSTYLLL